MYISPNKFVRDALAVIESSKEKIALVLDENQKLIGTITDGDIRRALLKGLSLDDKVSEVMNKHPITMLEGENPSTYIMGINNNIYEHVPVVDKYGRFLSLITLHDVLKDTKPKVDATVVIMAGGKGLRLRPLTEKIPKPMVEVNGKPMLEHLIDHVKIQGFRNIILSVNYRKEIIQDYFGDGKDFGVSLQYIEEETPLGTAGSLSLLDKSALTQNFLVMNADLVTNINLKTLLEFHTNQKNYITVCVKKHDLEVPFGVVTISNDDHLISEITEKPSYSFNVSAGIYVFNAEIINNLQKETYLDMPDLIRVGLREKRRIGAFSTYETWFDVGRIADLNKVRALGNV